MDWNITDINTGIGCVAGIKTRFEDPVGLINAMDTYRISNAVVFHTDALRDVHRGNALASEATKSSEGRLSPCYVLRSDLGGSEMPVADKLLAQLRAEKPAAVKLYPNAHRFILNEFYAGELLDVLNTLHMPILFDSDQKPSYESLPDLAKHYPDIKFIMLRQAINESRYARPLLEKLENVYFDAGIMIDTCFIEELVSKFGASKLLFGSGMPLYMPAGALGMIIYSRISDDDKQSIFSGNWNRIQEEIKWA
jgi:predicted TIM-barrel fold metal-dependent hydrolase